MKIDDQELREALEIFGKEYIAELSNQLRKADKVASGKLLKSLDTRVIKTAMGTVYTIQLLAEDYLEYIDAGRPPTKRKGNGAVRRGIEEWARLKGIPKSLVFPIVRSIHKKGYKGTNVIPKTLDKVQRGKGLTNFEDDVSDWVDDLVEQLILDVSKNNNITVRL